MLEIFHFSYCIVFALFLNYFVKSLKELFSSLSMVKHFEIVEAASVLDQHQELAVELSNP